MASSIEEVFALLVRGPVIEDVDGEEHGTETSSSSSGPNSWKTLRFYINLNCVIC